MLNLKLRWLLFVAFAAFSFLGCAKSTDPSKRSSDPSASRTPLKVGYEYKHNSKILVQYVSSKNETTIYQSDFKIHPIMTIASKPSNDWHEFEFNSSTTFPGKNPVYLEKSNALQILHSVKSKSDWHFRPKTKLTLITDGSKLELPVYDQSKLDKDLPTDMEFYESLIIAVPFEFYSKIAAAKDVRFQFGSTEFKLSDDNIAAFRDYAECFSAPA